MHTETQQLHDMVDAIREMLGKDPLYTPRPGACYMQVDARVVAIFETTFEVKVLTSAPIRLK